jgi:hypothetical protein
MPGRVGVSPASSVPAASAVPRRHTGKKKKQKKKKKGGASAQINSIPIRAWVWAWAWARTEWAGLPIPPAHGVRAGCRHTKSGMFALELILDGPRFLLPLLLLLLPMTFSVI